MRPFSKEELETPFDVITLPSQGMFYADNRSQLMVRYLTTREELVLTQPSLASNGAALDIVLNAVVMDEGVHIDDLIVSDRDAIILYLRSTSYGDKVTFNATCPLCSKTGETSFNLSELEIREPKDIPDEEGCFFYILPKMRIGKMREEVMIRFKPLTVREDKKMRMMVDYMGRTGKYKPNITEKYRAQMVDINGINDPKYIDDVIKSMPIADSLALRKHMDTVEPGIDNNVQLHCQSCGEVYKDEIYIGPEFLSMPIEHRKAIKEEQFLVRYYGKGITYQDTLNMSVTDRRWEIDRISQEIDKKNRAEQKAVDDAKRKAG